MTLSKKIKRHATTVFNLAREPFDKSFDFAKIQSDKLKATIDLKIQKRALLNLKAELAMRHKNLDNYTDEEIEVMLLSEKNKIIDDLKNKSLVGALALLGLDFLV